MISSSGLPVKDKGSALHKSLSCVEMQTKDGGHGVYDTRPSDGRHAASWLSIVIGERICPRCLKLLR